MKISLRNYTLRYFIVFILAIIALWAGLFYAYILDEVYDNIDDGLKNTKLKIVREAQYNPEIYKVTDFGISQFRVSPLKDGEYNKQNKFSNSMVYMEYDEEDQPVRTLSTVFRDPNNQPYLLEIRTSTIENDELLEDLFQALIVLYIMIVLSMVLIQRIALKRVWREFYELLSGLKNYKLDAQIPFKSVSSNVTEFNELGIEIERMIERSENIYSQQNQFIGNAAHELQTPLAIAINKLELYMENHHVNEQAMSQLSAISDTLMRLVRLNKALLLLTKIENKQYFKEELVNFNVLIKELLEEYQDLFEHKNIKVELTIQGEFSCFIHRDLAYILLSNLLKNAFHYNEKDGQISFTISQNSFIISNTSAAKPLDKHFIYQRFYKDSQHYGSVGLGLAIVKAIVETTKELQIAYSYEGMHSFKLYKL